MKSSNHWPGRQIAALLALLLAFPAGPAGSALAQEAAQAASASTSVAAAPENALPENPEPARPQAAYDGRQTAAPQSASGPFQDNNRPAQDNKHRAVGTAAAPYEPTVGIAASRPAGAAIAPAKQRRVRSILISLGVIAGAAIAIGSVAALSHGSPSRP